MPDYFLSLFHTCSYIQEHFCLATFHRCHGNAVIDGAKANPADGGNGTLIDANQYQTQQKKNKIGGGG